MRAKTLLNPNLDRFMPRLPPGMFHRMSSLSKATAGRVVYSRSAWVGEKRKVATESTNKLSWAARYRRRISFLIAISSFGCGGAETLPDEPEPCIGCNVILLVVDTLRADHLGVYGYPRPVSPFIDAFAEDALVFENVLAQSSWTRASMASILTGLLPIHHTAMTRFDKLPDEVTLLSELLAEQHYATIAFVTNPNILPRSGFDQGYDHFLRLHEPSPENTRYMITKADEVNEHVFKALDRIESNERNFIYVHYMDPHDPYIPNEPHFSKHDSISFTRQFIVQSFSKLQGAMRENALQQMINAYDDEIRFVDRHIGLLLASLDERGLLERSVVILVSDHGEEFLEHGGLAHGRTLHGEVLAVPLIIRVSGWPGRRIAGLVNQVDILPTVLELLGIEPPANLDGASRLRSQGPAENSFADLRIDGQRSQSLTTRVDKLIRMDRRNELEVVYFDLEADPGETRPLDRRTRIATLNQAIEELYAASVQRRVKASSQTEHDRGEMEQLKALGYVSE